MLHITCVRPTPRQADQGKTKSTEEAQLPMDASHGSANLIPSNPHTYTYLVALDPRADKRSNHTQRKHEQASGSDMGLVNIQ